MLKAATTCALVGQNSRDPRREQGECEIPAVSRGATIF